MSEGLSPRFAARVFAVLYFLCGLLVGLGNLFGSPVTVNSRAGLTVVALAIAGLAIGAWFLPWQRWPRGASLALPPAAFALLSLHNHFRVNDPHAHAIFFMVAFAWIGLAHPRGTCLRFAPLFAIAYAAPLMLSGGRSLSAMFPLAYAGAACLILGETLAWMSDGLGMARGSLQRVQETLRQREARFRSLVQNSSDVITILRADRIIQYHSVSIERVFGYGATQLLGTRLEDWVHPEDVPHVLAFLEEVLRGPGTNASVECRLRHRSGSWRHCGTTAVNLLHNENVAGVVLNIRDVSERKALEEELSHQAFHDSLTGLANRARFVERVQRALDEEQGMGAPVAVLFLDLDGFKTINDSLGHAAGDELLVAAARRLRSCVRPGDTAARLGGDEFAILIEDMMVPTAAVGIAERILDALRRPFSVQGKEVVVGASVGIAIGTSGMENTDDLLRNADVSMYEAKANGKGSYVVFQPRMHAAVLARLELESDLRRAPTVRELARP